MLEFDDPEFDPFYMHTLFRADEAVGMVTSGAYGHRMQKAEETAAGIKRISISLDGSTPETHDEFRGLEKAFENSIRGIKLAKEAGIEFQINTTITKTNLDEIPKILNLAEKLGAVAHHIFLPQDQLTNSPRCPGDTQVARPVAETAADGHRVQG